MAKRRVLFVDDESSIRLTLPAILAMHGYEVEAAATVADALAKMQQQKFDVLIADLNIGQPGDGFTVVSAMRRTQPEAVTLILTGYPAFETALEAIRQQVDDYVVKPANIDKLVQSIEQKLDNRTHHQSMPLVRACFILRQNEGEIVESWLQEVERNPELARVTLHRSERSDHVPHILGEMIFRLEHDQMELTRESVESARLHGRTRRKQGYTAPMVIEETRLLRVGLMQCVRDHLLNIDVSHLLPDLNCMDFVLDGMLAESIRAFLNEDRAAA